MLVHEIGCTPIADPDGRGRSDHWTDTANDLLVALILHVLYVEKNKSLAGVREFISHSQLNEKELFTLMANTIHDPEGNMGWLDPHTGSPTKTHPVVLSSAKDMLHRTDGERTGITSTVKRCLKLYRDPIVANNIRESDFKLTDLLDPEQSISLYINMPPSDKHRLRPLVRLFLSQLLGRFTEQWIPPEQRSQHRAPTLLLMDEFPQLGKLAFFESALAYTAGYGVKTLLICQDLSQIYNEYGYHQSILSSCDVTVIYAPNKLETAKHFSDMLGSQTITKKQKNYSGNRLSLSLNHINTSDQDHKRSLLTPDELMRLPYEQAIIFKTGTKPILSRKRFYFNDPILKQRAELVAPTQSDQLTNTHEWNYVEEDVNNAFLLDSLVEKKVVDENSDDFDLL
ncbi:MAG: type IV secretory system conjugative DNA transfer family protein [Legionellales bacterium]|nr:type IV secretory system conjugative DNA transfer family protein [Legionellales bacterium]